MSTGNKLENITDIFGVDLTQINPSIDDFNAADIIQLKNKIENTSAQSHILHTTIEDDKTGVIKHVFEDSTNNESYEIILGQGSIPTIIISSDMKFEV